MKKKSAKPLVPWRNVRTRDQLAVLMALQILEDVAAPKWKKFAANALAAFGRLTKAGGAK